MGKKRVYSQYTREALVLLGKQIQLGRKKQRWNESDLAERAGIARATLQKIEKGNPSCAIGLFFEVAVLAGVKLFDSEASSLTRHLARAENTLALLPRRIRHKDIIIDDEF